MNTSASPNTLLKAILESFIDGILVLTECQHQEYINETAKHFCHRLTGQHNSIPREVWRACEALIESRNLYDDRPIVIEHEVETESLKLRVRAQWLQLDYADHPYLLVRLQDQNQAIQGLAIAESQSWGLTERETQVWTLRRSGWNRKAIAAELYIAEDTVKKHLGNVRAKRQNYLDEETWRASQRDQSTKLLCTA